MQPDAARGRHRLHPRRQLEGVTINGWVSGPQIRGEQLHARSRRVLYLRASSANLFGALLLDLGVGHRDHRGQRKGGG